MSNDARIKCGKFFKAIIFNSKGNFTLLMNPNFRTAVMILKQLFEFGASLGSFIKLESMSHKRQNEHKKSHDCCVSAFTLERFVASKLLRFCRLTGYKFFS